STVNFMAECQSLSFNRRACPCSSTPPVKPSLERGSRQYLVMSPDFQEMSRLGRCAHEFQLTDGTRLTCEEVVRVVPGKRIVVRGRWQEQAVYAKLFLGKGAQRYADRDRRGVEALQAAGIATPALLAIGAIGSGAVVLVFEAVADSVNVEQAWETMTSAERRTLAAGLVTEVARHHAAGLVQRDLYLKNFLLQGERIL